MISMGILVVWWVEVMLNSEWLGRADINLKKAVAGSLESWTITYTVGKYGIDDKGNILIVQRDISDMQIPQFTSPSESGYVTVKTTGNARLKAKFYSRFFIRPWRGGIFIRVYDGALREGDKVIVTFGDRSEGSPGFRVQTFREKRHVFRVLVDPFGTGKFMDLESSPSMEIVGGPAEKLEVVAPSIVRVGESFHILVRALDKWGNPSESYVDTVYLSCSDGDASIPEECSFNGDGWAAKRLNGIILRSPGIHYIYAKSSSGLTAKSNPILCLKNASEFKLFWGDLHGQTEITIGTGTVEEYFTYARDVAGIDFTSWQGNDFQIERRDWWKDVCVQVKRFHEPGKFITFLGYEWSGITSAGGDHNIYFLHDDQQLYRSSHWLVEDKSDLDTDRYPISELWKTFRGRRDVMAIPHVGGRPANFDFYDPDFIHVIEIYSQHGLFEWFAREALDRGLEVGFIAGSDDHTGRPGLTYPTEELSIGEPFGVKGGLTGVFARDLTRESIWEALWNRRCYATTGDRIILFFTSDGHFMGEKYSTDKPPKLNLKVIGTSGIQEIEFRRGSSTIYTHIVSSKSSRRFLKIEWSGLKTKFRAKRTVWDGKLTLSDGGILNAIPFAFDRFDEGLTSISDRSVSWKSTSYGDPDGVILELDAPKDASITFNSTQGTFTFKLEEVEDNIKVVKLGPVDKMVRIVPLYDSRDVVKVDLTYTDHDVKPGVNPYWVKVVQWNGEIAWSSPIFIKYVKAT